MIWKDKRLLLIRDGILYLTHRLEGGNSLIIFEIRNRVGRFFNWVSMGDMSERIEVTKEP